MTPTTALAGSAGLFVGNTDAVVVAVTASVAVLRDLVQSLDEVFTTFEQEPTESSPRPEELADVKAHLRASLISAENAGLLLLGRVFNRALALAESVWSGQTLWGIASKLALEELVTVVDMILDVVALVGTDSGCRHEERVSFRILAATAPQVLVDVDRMDFREIRFHQASAGDRELRTG